MNAVEIEQAISELAEQPFDAAEFPFAFLQAFGNRETTLKRLRRGETNKSDLGGVLQTKLIHLATTPPGQVTQTLAALKTSPATTRARAQFILATDGETLEAEDLTTGETLACPYPQFPDHFGFFLPLAGITTVKQVRESAFDIRATSRLNRLYVQLLQDNPDWGAADRRPDMNHFMARLIFCFFAEDTDIFHGDGLFTATIEQMSARDASDTHQIIAELFRAMNTPIHARPGAALRPWADAFPYVNGGLFSGSPDAPRFSRIARSYLLHIGHLDWTRINPDIFGSMIQAVADDEERGALGMHYTSVPNILKVLDPLFLDDLRAKLDEAEANPRKLLNLRNRIARIRVFDPACGSGNFLVIAYKQMRAIEADINARRNEHGRRSDIPLTNFRGIELRDFPAEIARLALIIAEYQCNVLHRGQQEALAEFLPLNAENWIVRGNALRLDWLTICPPTGTGVRLVSDDLFHTPLDQAQIDFENSGGETYICGNPPFSGTRRQSDEQKSDLESVFCAFTNNWKNVDYVGGWFLKAARFNQALKAPFSFVATNSFCQGQQVSITWQLIFKSNMGIRFAHTSFTWSNLANNKAGVTVVVVGLDSHETGFRHIYSNGSVKLVDYINPYLTEHRIESVPPSRHPLWLDVTMEYGVYYSKSDGLIMDSSDREQMIREGLSKRLTRKFLGSTQFINGVERFCLWIGDDELGEALKSPRVKQRVDSVRNDRLATSDIAVNLHLSWIATVCGRLRTDYSYSNVLGWNTFPVPTLTEQNKTDLTHCAEQILLAREAHFPATIADLYDPETMPENLRHAHDRNDETLERIYIGRRFRNDTERLEKLFELYTQMTTTSPAPQKRRPKARQ